MHADGRKVVLAALAGNVAIAACKLAAAYLSGSTATLAEAVHSIADTGNQGLLLLGMSLAGRPPDERHPFGRARERYFWPFVVALLLFSAGGAFAIFDGVSHLTHPGGEVQSRGWSYAVLGVSLAIEAASFRIALDELRKLTAGRPLAQALREVRDPTIPLVLAEDATAMAGLVLALAAVGASGWTGKEYFDPIGSVVIGLLLCAVALGIARLSHGLLIGESATPDDQARLRELTRQVRGVEAVVELLTLHLGPDDVLVAMKIAFSPALTVAELEDVTNAVEARIRAAMPRMRKIFIEADSRGDRPGAAAPGATLPAK
jgi:cation diffusion facilitator family transporter